MFVQAWKQTSRLFGRRAMSTGVPVGDAVASSAGVGALLAAVGTTFGTYMIADFLSNFIQHPTQLVSYAENAYFVAYVCPTHHGGHDTRYSLNDALPRETDGLRLLQSISWT